MQGRLTHGIPAGAEGRVEGRLLSPFLQTCSGTRSCPRWPAHPSRPLEPELHPLLPSQDPGHLQNRTPAAGPNRLPCYVLNAHAVPVTLQIWLHALSKDPARSPILIFQMKSLNLGKVSWMSEGTGRDRVSTWERHANTIAFLPTCKGMWAKPTTGSVSCFKSLLQVTGGPGFLCLTSSESDVLLWMVWKNTPDFSREGRLRSNTGFLGGRGVSSLSSAEPGCRACLSALVSAAGSLSQSGLCLLGLW